MTVRSLSMLHTKRRSFNTITSTASDYTILAWRLKSLVTDDSPGSSSAATLPHNSFPLTLHIRNPEDPLPKPPAYVNPSYYVYRRPASLSPSLSDSRSHNHDGMRTQSRAAGRSMKSSKSKQSHGSTSERGGTGVPQFKKDFMNFHSENGVRTVIGKIGPVRNGKHQSAMAYINTSSLPLSNSAHVTEKRI